MPTATEPPVPTATPQSTATETPVPTATQTPVPTPTPTVAPTPTNTPVPTPTVNPVLASYSPLLVEAVTSYPAGLDFVGDGLSPEEQNTLDWADGRLFSNPNFLASIYGPDNWPSEVKLASVQAVPLLMLAIDIEKKPDGKHVIDWEVDSLDRILDELGIYEGVCVSCYGKNDYDTADKVSENYYAISDDPQHIHREMLKTFAYLSKADGEGILIRGFMENDADDFELVYNRDAEASRRVGSLTNTEFGWRNLSFMSQIRLPDGSVKSFPTQVYEIVGGAGSEREAAERWFEEFTKVTGHFRGDHEDFANIYRPYSQTPYTPEPGYLLSVGLAGSPSSTGTTVSALRSVGLKAEQFLSPEKGRRTGAVEIDGEWYYHDGNRPLGGFSVDGVGFELMALRMCLLLAPLEVVEDTAATWKKHCAYRGTMYGGGSATGEIIGDSIDSFGVLMESGRTYRLRGKGSLSDGGTLPRVAISICGDRGWNYFRCKLISAETEGTKDPDIIFTASDTEVSFATGDIKVAHHLFVKGVGGATGTYTVEVEENSP